MVLPETLLVRYHSKANGRPIMQCAIPPGLIKMRVQVIQHCTLQPQASERSENELHNLSFIDSGIHLVSILLTNLFVCSAKVNVRIYMLRLARLKPWSDSVVRTVWGRIRARWAK